MNHPTTQLIDALRFVLSIGFVIVAKGDKSSISLNDDGSRVTGIAAYDLFPYNSNRAGSSSVEVTGAYKVAINLRREEAAPS